MDPRLLQYYNTELQYIRGMGAEFAKAFPKIARRLNLEEFECADPYVERLLEGFAFLAARVQLKMDDEFPRLTQHLIEMLYPDFLAQTPSMTVVKFEPDYESGDLETGFNIPRGTELRSLIGENDQTACQYSTSHPVVIWPLEITRANYFTQDSTHVGLPPDVPNSRAGVRIGLANHSGNFDKLECQELDFFLTGNLDTAAHLYEQIFANCTAIGLRDSDQERWLGWLPISNLEPIGFEDDESLLPCENRSFQGYRLLKEYFCFHQRFLFFRLTGLAQLFQQCNSPNIELFLLFSRVDRTIDTNIDKSNFALNCVPAVNLFKHRAERIHVSDAKHEFHIIADRVRPMDMEVCKVESVNGLVEGADDVIEVAPFYSFRNSKTHAPSDHQAFYTIRRVPRLASERQRRLGYRTGYLGSECYISLVDNRSNPIESPIEQLDISVLCSNRDLTTNMPINSGPTDFSLQISAPVKSTTVVAGPTAPLPSMANESGDLLWKLVNHLSLNYLSLVDDDSGQGAMALRGLLKLYTQSNDASIQKQIDGIRTIQSQIITKRMPLPGPVSFGRGLEIELTLEESNFQGYGTFLIAAVLSRFFQRFSSINSFTETVLRTDKRNEVMRWPAVIGNRKVL